MYQRKEVERAVLALESTEAQLPGLFAFQPSPSIDSQIPLENERQKLKKLQRKYRKATSNLQSAVQTASKSTLQKDVRLSNLRAAIGNLVEAEAADDGKEFHRWFFVMAKAYEELENYLESDDDPLV